MGQINPPQPVQRLIAISSRYQAAIDWSCEQIADAWGPIALKSQPFQFSETDYYTATMGPDLLKQFVILETLTDPSELATIKRQTNAWEAEYAALDRHPEPRPLNLDPGYLTLAKLVLASTKDHAHRIYLRDGIFAEVTLNYRAKQWQPMEWTFPDYRRDDYHEFFGECRELLRRQPRIADKGLRR